jgi:hypothetical protein
MRSRSVVQAIACGRIPINRVSGKQDSSRLVAITPKRLYLHLRSAVIAQ